MILRRSLLSRRLWLPFRNPSSNAQRRLCRHRRRFAIHGAGRPRAEPGSKRKAAVPLRLDPTRHLKLRLACAVNGRSAQQLVTDALDALLKEMPELESMAEKAPRKKSA